MKKGKNLILCMLFVMTLMVMTGCSNKGNTNNPGTGTTGTTGQTSAPSATTGERTTEAARENGTNTTDESSKGVIEGMVDDVERGVDDLMGDGTKASETRETTSPSGR